MYTVASIHCRPKKTICDGLADSNYGAIDFTLPVDSRLGGGYFLAELDSETK